MAPEQTAHRLAAIMFTDIVGYTAAMAESEAKGHHLRERHRQLLRPVVESYGGTWVQEVGDETLSSFPSAIEAANCALAIQAAVANEPDLQIRIGIHVGDVVVRQGSPHGDAVNIAARVRPLAEPGGVCISGEVQQAIRNQPNLETASLGEHDLKNVGRPVTVYALGGEPAAPEPQEHRPRLRARPVALAGVAAVLLLAVGLWSLSRIGDGVAPIRSLAVLPLENLSGDPEQEYFADGMTEALITDLARIGALTVISRTSVMRYKNSDKSLPEIAKELNVDGIIEGTVLRDGDHVRITAQLIDARTDGHIWGDRYDRDLRDILALHSDVAWAVAQEVRVELSPDEKEALRTSRTVDPRAYDAYLRGIQIWGPVTRVDIWAPKAITHFEKAVEIDSGFAEAYAQLARVRVTLAVGLSWTLGDHYREVFSAARENAMRALDLDPRLSAAWAMLGSIRIYSDWDFERASRDFDRARALGPSEPLVLVGYSGYLMIVARPEEALEVTDHLIRIAPLDPSFRDDRVRALVWARKYERALDEAERARELDPDFYDLSIAEAYQLLNRLKEAHGAYLAADIGCGAPCAWSREARERGWTEGGWKEAQRAWLEAAIQKERSPYLIATAYAGIGETGEALAWLERGYRERSPLMVQLKAHPIFDPLRSDPRFADLLRRIGFPES